jgi:cardiolipin synthase A/B
VDDAMLLRSEVWAIGYLTVEWAIRLLMVAIVPFRRGPEAARSWLLLVFFLPIPAVVIYALIGRPTYPRRRRSRFAKLPHVLKRASKELVHSRFCRNPELPGNLAGPALLIERLGQFPTLAGNEIELVSDYDGVINRLIGDIDQARKTVHLLFYIFADDEIGRRVMAALVRAAHRGVKCRVLIDAIGSRQWARRVEKLLAIEGVEVQFALPVGILRRKSGRADLRNHRKIAVLDSRIGYIGSQNIVNAEFRRGITYEELVARVTGPVTTELQAAFIADWFMETDEELTRPELFPHHHPDTGIVAQILPSGPDYPEAGIADAVVALIHGARKRIVITTPYFIPDSGLTQALRTAVLRGVEVCLVTSYQRDQLFVSLAQRSYYSELLQSGIHIFLYKPRFLHAKHATFDEDIAVIGSSNLDIRSFVLNAEISLIAYHRDVVAGLRREQERYIAASEVLNLATWEQRAIAGKLCENLARLASPLL